MMLVESTVHFLFLVRIALIVWLGQQEFVDFKLWNLAAANFFEKVSRLDVAEAL